MPSKLFYSTQTSLATQGLASTLGSTFKKNIRTENGVYLGRNRILVGGQEYQFQNTSGQTIDTGASVAVQNIGRKAAAIYAPTDLPTGLAVSGGSGSSSSTTGNFVLKEGDTMTGLLTLSGPPSSPLQAVTKTYADTLANVYVRKMISFRG